MAMRVQSRTSAMCMEMAPSELRDGVPEYSGVKKSLSAPTCLQSDLTALTMLEALLELIS